MSSGAYTIAPARKATRRPVPAVATESSSGEIRDSAENGSCDSRRDGMTPSMLDLQESAHRWDYWIAAAMIAALACLAVDAAVNFAGW